MIVNRSWAHRSFLFPFKLSRNRSTQLGCDKVEGATALNWLYNVEKARVSCFLSTWAPQRWPGRSWPSPGAASHCKHWKWLHHRAQARLHGHLQLLHLPERFIVDQGANGPGLVTCNIAFQAMGLTKPSSPGSAPPSPSGHFQKCRDLSWTVHYELSCYDSLLTPPRPI